MSKYVERRIVSSEFEDDGFLERVHEEVKMSLKRCPCCGRPAKTEHIELEEEDYLIVRCTNCGVQTRPCSTHEECAEAWNARKVALTRSGAKVHSCPFCGGKAEVDYCDDATDIFVVKCAKCGARTGGTTNVQAAVKVWNRRM